MPLIMMLRQSFIAEARPGSVVTAFTFMPRAVRIVAASSAAGPPARIGTLRSGPGTGAITAPST